MRARIMHQALAATRRMTSMSRIATTANTYGGTYFPLFTDSNVMPYTSTRAYSTADHSSHIKNIINECIDNDKELSEEEKSQLVNSVLFEVTESITNIPRNFKINKSLQEYYDNIEGHVSNDPNPKIQEVKGGSEEEKSQLVNSVLFEVTESITNAPRNFKINKSLQEYFDNIEGGVSNAPNPKVQEVKGGNEAQENVKDETTPKMNDSSVKNIMSSKELQEKVFKEAKEHVKDNRGLLFFFNLVENPLKKVSSPLFDGLYTVFADKDGIPDHKSQAVISLAKWIVLAILIYSLHQYYIKKYEEIEKMDKSVIARYAEVEELYDKAVLIIQECTRQLNLINELERDIELNLELLNLLDNCATSENDPDGYIAKFKVFFKTHTQARIDSVLHDKSFKTSKLDHKIERELKSREEHNPLASKLLEAKGSKGFQGTKNALEDKILELDREIEHKKEGIVIKNKQIRLKTDKISEIREKTEKDEAIINKYLLVRFGIFTPQFPVIKKKCDELRNTEIENEEDNVDALRMSVD